MKQTNPTYKTKLFYGLLVIVPIAAIIVVLAKIIELIELLAKSLGLDSYLSTSIVIVLALAGIILLCYGIGSLVHTRIGSWSFDKFEQLLLTKIPGYRIIKNIFIDVSGENVKAYKPALLKLGSDGTAVLGFIMEYNENGTTTVFVPHSPVLTVGTIYVVENNRVTPLESGHLAMINCLSEWGTGSSKVLGTTEMK
ncbi:MAG: DUF502 domain-containing protein [Desulfobacterales bacterium]|nr:DUF502 domain-containing protein [Desulfobacterales bacterium]